VESGEDVPAGGSLQSHGANARAGAEERTHLSQRIGLLQRLNRLWRLWNGLRLGRHLEGTGALRPGISPVNPRSPVSEQISERHQS
jgi:hypothetical protein